MFMNNFMYSHKTTVAEDMYLITIFMIYVGDAAKPVPISIIAEELNVQPVSANQMVKRMAEKGLVDYSPYQGVVLTDQGSDQARRVLWSRRLWEIFLVRDLGLPLDKAEKIACDLEHHISTEVAERLDAFLDYPAFCYHGEHIPRGKGDDAQPIESVPLSELEIGGEAVIIEINGDSVTQRWLSSEGVSNGAHIRIIATGYYGDCLIECAGRRAHIAEKIAAEILVSKAQQVRS